jgi:predicted nucleic acid-binding protein
MRLSFCDNLIDEYWTISLNSEEALGEAIRLNHSVYDLLYLTIARRTAATLLTQDKMLKDLALQQGVDVF